MPERIGRYRVLSLLGEGGMGVVYAARDESLGREIAIKTIREPDPSARKRFWREARAAATVDHPNICQLFEIGEDGGRLFLAMERLTGQTLAERITEGPLPAAEVAAIGRGILSALSSLHGKGIVHRDLKPSNVFLTPHGVKVLDFGLARPLPTELTQTIEEGTELTRPGLLVGTPRYMAPEQVLGEAVSEHTDIFAAGAVLYEALSGRPAFVGTTVVEVLSSTLHVSPPALSGPAAVVSIDRVLRRALAKKPAERYASAEEMSRALAEIPTGDAAAPATATHTLTRLIVLPFRLPRPDPDIDFLGFTLADAVTASLADLPSLVVRSSAAAQRSGEIPNVKEIAAAVEADLVVTGTLLRSGDQLRLTSQLVEAATGTLVSSFTTQSPVGDVFRLQDELAERLVSALSLTLVGREHEARRDVPASARAYELFLRGNEVARDWTRVREARDLYDQCLKEDPGYAPAWARLARCHRLTGKYFLEEPAANLGPGRVRPAARPRDRPRSPVRPQGVRPHRGRGRPGPRCHGSPPRPRSAPPQRPRGLRGPGPQLPVRWPPRGLPRRPPGGPPPRPPHQHERQLHPLDAGRLRGGPRRDRRPGRPRASPLRPPGPGPPRRGEAVRGPAPAALAGSRRPAHLRDDPRPRERRPRGGPSGAASDGGDATPTRRPSSSMAPLWPT